MIKEAVKKLKDAYIKHGSRSIRKGQSWTGGSFNLSPKELRDIEKATNPAIESIKLTFAKSGFNLTRTEKVSLLKKGRGVITAKKKYGKSSPEFKRAAANYQALKMKLIRRKNKRLATTGAVVGAKAGITYGIAHSLSGDEKGKGE